MDKFQQSTQNLYDRIKTAAYRNMRDDDDDDDDDFESGFASKTRVLSIVYPEER